jgi:hypothetical protein
LKCGASRLGTITDGGTRALNNQPSKTFIPSR